MSTAESRPPFQIKDCALAAIATGFKAQSLLGLRERLAALPANWMYYHFWGGRLRTSFEHREYHNDFSFWSHQCLHDDILAERLELLNPTDYPNMEALISDLIEIIDNRIDEREIISWSKPEEQFHFIRSKIFVFHTNHSINHPRELVNVFPLLSRSSLFYHFIDSARRVPERIDDFSLWLLEYKDEYQDLIAELRKIDPYFISLAHLQAKLTKIATDYFLGERP